MRWEYNDANGKGYSSPLHTHLFRGIYQQKDIIEMDLTDHPKTINSKTNINFKLLANTLLVIHIFPEKLVVGGYFKIKKLLKMKAFAGCTSRVKKSPIE